MEKHFSKRRLIPVAAALLALVCASGVVYAYWTAGGSGTGIGHTAAGVTNLTAEVNPAIPLTAMYPGDSAQIIHVTIHNPSTTQTVYVTSVAVSVGDSTPSGCGAANFTVGTATAVGQEIAAGASINVDGPTIQFKDLGTNQDICKNVQVNLTFTIS